MVHIVHTIIVPYRTVQLDKPDCAFLPHIYVHFLVPELQHASHRFVFPEVWSGGFIRSAGHTEILQLQTQHVRVTLTISICEYAIMKHPAFLHAQHQRVTLTIRYVTCDSKAFLPSYTHSM
jgi:hypothetical protein